MGEVEDKTGKSYDVTYIIGHFIKNLCVHKIIGKEMISLNFPDRVVLITCVVVGTSELEV